MLVQKLRTNQKGTRIMWDAAVNDPWAKVLKQRGVSVECLTARALGRVREVLARAT